MKLGGRLRLGQSQIPAEDVQVLLQQFRFILPMPYGAQFNRTAVCKDEGYLFHRRSHNVLRHERDAVTAGDTPDKTLQGRGRNPKAGGETAQSTQSFQLILVVRHFLRVEEDPSFVV